jgi:hypothetical protein
MDPRYGNWRSARAELNVVARCTGFLLRNREVPIHTESFVVFLSPSRKMPRFDAI